MNKTDLVRAIYARKNTKLSMIQIENVIDDMLIVMQERLSMGEEVQLADFGTFAKVNSSIKSMDQFLTKPRQKK